MENKQSKISQYIDTVYMAVGEIIVAALISAVYLIIKKFDYTVLTGALLGGGVTVLNLFILSVSVNRAINKYIEERGDSEMSEEEAAEFSKTHTMQVQNAVTRSYLLRTLMMVASLFIALMTDWFNPIATVIPLLMYRPIIYLTELVKTKLRGRRGD